LAASLIYRSPLLYELAMALLYGRHYFARYRALAGLLPPGARVLDLACGPATLYHRYLRHRGVRYTGLDINARFIRWLVRSGGRGQVWDLGSDRPLPETDYAVMQASLYHFLPDPSPVVGRMLAAASHQVIIAEPVRNLADSRLPFLAALARRLTNPGSGVPVRRFTETTLDAFFAPYARGVQSSFLIPGGREKVYVLAGQRAQPPPLFPG
jgi:SAM-dependent methyltransferase